MWVPETIDNKYHQIKVLWILEGTLGLKHVDYLYFNAGIIRLFVWQYLYSYDYPHV